MRIWIIIGLVCMELATLLCVFSGGTGMELATLLCVFSGATHLTCAWTTQKETRLLTYVRTYVQYRCGHGHEQECVRTQDGAAKFTASPTLYPNENPAWYARGKVTMKSPGFWCTV